LAASLSAQDAERLRAFEREGHTALATGYCDFFAQVTALAIEPLLDAVHLAPGMRLLDVATGPGNLAAAASRRGAQPIGVDLSSGMIELARRRHPGIEFREADVEHLPFADGTFDAVVCSFGLGHFPYPDAAVAECLRTLKKGGRIACAWWAEPSRQRIQGLFREAAADVGIAPPAGLPAGHSSLRFCQPAEFLRLLREAHLADVAIEEHAGTHLVKSAEELWNCGLGGMVLSGAAIRSQDKATQDVIWAAFERRALAYKGENGLNVPVAFRIGSGRKPD
jgi:SAM-dependent methyltransferase